MRIHCVHSIQITAALPYKCREAEADGLRRQQQAAEEEALARFDAELAAAGWSDAYDRVSGHVYYVRAISTGVWQ